MRKRQPVHIDESWYRRTPQAKDRTSAGGIVLRREGGRILVAFAREKDYPQFVLPKGGVEPGETLEDAARREILEETGLSELALLGKLATLERLSFDKTRWLTVHYFLFTTTQVDAHPTESDRHHGMWWYPLDDLPPMMWPEQRRLIEDQRPRLEAAFDAAEGGL